MHTGRFTGGAVFDSSGNALVNPVVNSDTGFDYVNGPQPPRAGDFNPDGILNAADYVVWRKGLGTTYTQDDYNIWRTNFGATAGSGSGLAGILPSQSAVPESSTSQLLLLACAIVGLTVQGRSSMCNRRPESSTTKEHLPCLA
jgi:hypothetical protein